MNKMFCLAGILVLSMGNAVASVHNITCTEQQYRFIDPLTLKSTIYKGGTVYRFYNGDLFISSKDKAEYKYNKVVETEYLRRYVSGHKTILFDADKFTDVVIVHVADKLEVRVSHAKCDRG